MSAIRQLSAAPSVRAAEELRQKRERESAWPYEHEFPPVVSEVVNGGTQGPVATPVPAPGSTVTIATFLVPSGQKFFMLGIWLCFDGAFNPGDSLFTVTENPNGGSQANPVQGLIQVPVPLGSWKNGTMWMFERAYEFASLSLLTAMAKNVNLTSPNTNSYVAGFFGYLVPSTDPR